MNIGIVTAWFERGAGYVSRQFYDVLKDSYNVFIYARGGEEYAKGNENWDKENVKWGKKCGVPLPTYIDTKDFTDWLLMNNIDMVLFNEQHWWEPVLLCNKMNIKTGAYIDYYTEETIPMFIAYDFLICNTKRHYSAFDWHPQCFYIPWGTDMNIFKPNGYQLKRDNIVTFFHSAGFNPKRKGTDLLIKAYSQLGGNDSKLIIHTQKKLTDVFPDLSELISQLTTENKLECFEGTVSAPGLYHLGDVYVYPSLLDGIGLTIAEALSCGLPVITNENPPMNEFVNEENGKLTRVSRLFSRKDGYYWPQCHADLDDLANNMKYYIDNKEILPFLKKNAREYALKKLDWLKNSKSLPEILESVIKLENELKIPVQMTIRAFENRRMPFQRFPRVLSFSYTIWKTVQKIVK